MGCEQVCLKWNNFSLNITKNIDDLWKDESLVDVSIISDGQCIQAHKVILSASSPLFKSLFAVNPCQHPVIILQDVRFRELASIITFIYKGEVNIFEENLPSLLQAAKTLQIRGLSDSVDRDSINRLYSLRSDESERASKKRKTHNSTIDLESQQTEETTATTNVPETIIPKEEPKLDNFPADFLASVSDDETDVKAEDILHERTQEILQTDIGQTDVEAILPTDTSLNSTLGTWIGYPCPFCTRNYTNWGFRRRHIKAMHCQLETLPCKLCPQPCSAEFSLEQWIYHMLDEHQVNSGQVQHQVSVFKEAKIVLQEANTTHDRSLAFK